MPRVESFQLFQEFVHCAHPSQLDLDRRDLQRSRRRKFEVKKDLESRDVNRNRLEVDSEGNRELASEVYSRYRYPSVLTCRVS